MTNRANVACLAALAILALDATTASASSLLHKPPRKSTAQLRAEYLSGIAEPTAVRTPERTAGSIWSAGGAMIDPSSDYKAHSLNDAITVVVSVQSNAAQSGSVDSGRNFSANSAISGLAGALSTIGTNPLLDASSATSLKGSGATSSSTAFSTSLTGQVIEVLPNGNLVIEASRKVDMNNQHEQIIVRGIARPGDISPLNSVASSSLSALQIEVKGKGIISDSVRPPNPLTRAILWLFGF